MERNPRWIVSDDSRYWKPHLLMALAGAVLMTIFWIGCIRALIAGIRGGAFDETLAGAFGSVTFAPMVFLAWYNVRAALRARRRERERADEE